MKKFFKTGAFCLVLMMAFLLSACGLGGYDVTFVDYNGDIIGTKTYSVNETVTKSNSPTPPNRLGFDFVQWSYDNPDNIVPNGKVETESVMYAQYKLDVNDSVFQQSGSKIDWYGGNASITTYLNAGQTKTILLNDGIGYMNLTTVTISPTSGSGFSLADFKVYDARGLEINRNSTILNIWAVLEPNAGNYSYVLVITAEYAGEITISVC